MRLDSSDPLYSSGVLLALRSGEMAADAIAEGLKSGDVSAAQLGKWGQGFNEGVDRMRRLVCDTTTVSASAPSCASIPNCAAPSPICSSAICLPHVSTRSGSPWSRSTGRSIATFLLAARQDTGGGRSQGQRAGVAGRAEAVDRGNSEF